MDDRRVSGSRWDGIKIPLGGVLVGFIGVLGVVLVSKVTGSPIGSLTRDVTTLCAEAGSRLKPYDGFESIANITLWACAATAALIVAFLVPARARWMTVLAAFLLFLCADDALSLHEQTHNYLPIPEKSFYVVYAVFALTLAWGSLTAVRERRAPLSELGALCIGGFFFALSIAVDQLTERHHLFEDGPKLIGACVWLSLPLIFLPQLRDRLRASEPTASV